MDRALELAEVAAAEGDVPVGALVLRDGEVIAVGWNTRQAGLDPCGHAEVNALRAAAQSLGSWYLEGCTVVVTLEPCAMCAGAMVLSRIARCVYAAADPKGGFLGSLGDLSSHPGLNHTFEVVAGVREAEAAAQLKRFFRALRLQKKQQRQERGES